VTPEAVLLPDKARQSLAIADNMVGEWPAGAGHSAIFVITYEAQIAPSQNQTARPRPP
jgi:hypothetical protein